VQDVSTNVIAQLDVALNDRRELTMQINKLKKTLENHAKRKENLKIKEKNLNLHHQKLLEKLGKQQDENKVFETTLSGLTRDNAHMEQLMTRLRTDFASLEQAYSDEKSGLEEDTRALPLARRNVRTQGKENLELQSKLRNAHTSHLHLWDRYVELERRSQALGTVLKSTVSKENPANVVVRKIA